MCLIFINFNNNKKESENTLYLIYHIFVNEPERQYSEKYDEVLEKIHT